MCYAIYPLATGFMPIEDEAVDLHEGITLSMKQIPAISFLLSNGTENVLVDTGMPKTKIAQKHRANSVQPPGYSIEEKLSSKGIAIKSLSAIIFTHLHWDHCAYLHKFKGITKIVQILELEFAIKPSPKFIQSYKEATFILEDADLNKINGTTHYNSEISIFQTPGHSPGHQSVLVQTDQGPVIIAGDSIWLSDGIFLPPRKFTNKTFAEKTYANLLNLKIPLLCSHDQSVL